MDNWHSCTNEGMIFTYAAANEKDREEARKVNHTISEQTRKEEQEKASTRKRHGALIDKYISLEKREN